MLTNEISNLRLQPEDSREQNNVSTVPPSKEGCTHCRRLWVDALSSDRTAMDIIDSISDKFRNEDLFRMKLSGEQIKEKRRKLTGPILERIQHKVAMMM